MQSDRNAQTGRGSKGEQAQIRGGRAQSQYADQAVLSQQEAEADALFNSLANKGQGEGYLDDDLSGSAADVYAQADTAASQAELSKTGLSKTVQAPVAPHNFGANAYLDSANASAYAPQDLNAQGLPAGHGMQPQQGMMPLGQEAYAAPHAPMPNMGQLGAAPYPQQFLGQDIQAQQALMAQQAQGQVPASTAAFYQASSAYPQGAMGNMGAMGTMGAAMPYAPEQDPNAAVPEEQAALAGAMASRQAAVAAQAQAKAQVQAGFNQFNAGLDAQSGIEQLTPDPSAYASWQSQNMGAPAQNAAMGMGAMGTMGAPAPVGAQLEALLGTPITPQMPNAAAATAQGVNLQGQGGMGLEPYGQLPPGYGQAAPAQFGMAGAPHAAYPDPAQAYAAAQGQGSGALGNAQHAAAELALQGQGQFGQSQLAQSEFAQSEFAQSQFAQSQFGQGANNNAFAENQPAPAAENFAAPKSKHSAYSVDDLVEESTAEADSAWGAAAGVSADDNYVESIEQARNFQAGDPSGSYGAEYEQATAADYPQQYGTPEASLGQGAGGQGMGVSGMDSMDGASAYNTQAQGFNPDNVDFASEYLNNPQSQSLQQPSHGAAHSEHVVGLGSALDDEQQPFNPQNAKSGDAYNSGAGATEFTESYDQEAFADAAAGAEAFGAGADIAEAGSRKGNQKQGAKQAKQDDAPVLDDLDLDDPALSFSAHDDADDATYSRLGKAGKAGKKNKLRGAGAGKKGVAADSGTDQDLDAPIDFDAFDGDADASVSDTGAGAGKKGVLDTGVSDTGGADSTEKQGNFLYQWRERMRAKKQARKQYKEDLKAGRIPKPTCGQRFKQCFFGLLSLGWKVGLAGICVCIGLFIYFDAVVINEYEVDDKWVLPAVVYSRPLELYPDQRLSLDNMVYELELLKYREVSSPRKQGEYALNRENGRIVLIKRQFLFPEGEEPAMSVLVEFDGKRVKRIINADTKQELGYMRMDPVLLDRINRINPQEDRIFITLDEVPKDLITTLIEIEDRTYFTHMGINPMAIGRAFVKNFIAGGVVEGGSTITQQLVKNYFLTNERSYSRKIKEMFMAIAMNHRYTKEQILEAYMNEIYLGQNGNAGIYGFGLASYFYFGVPVAELSLDQMALLVGLIKGPSYYDPWRHPENALERRNTVLAVLRNRGHISPERFEMEAAKPLNVIARGQLNYSKTPAFIGLVKTEIGTRFKEQEELTGKDFLSGNGIRIFTSLDPQAQIAAEQAVQNEIAAIEKERKIKGLEAAMIVSSWRTGEVSAVVGSSNPKFDGYNRVLDSRRQVGSLIKPFVYLTAFHQGYHLGSIVNDTPVQVKLPDGKIWAPKNDDKRFRGPIRVIKAMASSLNVPTVRVGMGSGLDNVINTLRATGFNRKVDMYPSIVLGTPEISPYELNSMYVGMATEGIYRNLTTLRTVVKNGEIVYQRGSNRSERTLDPKDTYLAIYGMTEATRSGTGRRIHTAFPDVTIASKTGTTNDYRDSWTVGMDSDELSTVWVGFDNNKSTGLYGSTGAMRLYIAYLKSRGVNSLELNKPQGVSFVNFDKQGNVLASGCEEPGMDLLPAREDRIQYVKQCFYYGDPNLEDAPFVVPGQQGLPSTTPAQSMPGIPGQPQVNGPANIPGQGQSGQPMPVDGLNNPSNMAIQGGQGQVQGGMSGQPMAPGGLIPPNQDALQSASVEDSQAHDVQPVAPDANARPTQSSSSNIERQADSFEDQLLGL